MVCLLCGAHAKQQAPASPINREAELNLKGVYVYQMCKFVTWPAEAFPPQGKPLVIGVMQNADLGKVLDAIAAKNRTAHGRTLEIRKLEKPADTAGCHLVILGGGMKPEDQTKVIQQLAKRPVVVVAETEGMGKAGAHFNFYLTPQLQIHFEINVKAAKASNLTIDPQVTALNFVRLLK